MVSGKLILSQIRAIILRKLSLSFENFDTLDDVSKEAISVAASALGARSDMVPMLSTGGVIGPLAGVVVVDEITGVCDDI